jgi:hypothetical protein
LVAGNATIEVEVTPDPAAPPGASSASPGLVVMGMTAQGQQLFDSAALVAANTGVNPLGLTPEIQMTVDPKTLSNEWFDPSGAARTTPVPADKHDYLSIALHELIHGLGFFYLRTDPTVAPPPGSGTTPGGISRFASMTSFGAGGNPNVLYFVGPQAEARFGGPVPLYSVPSTDPRSISNYSHIGNPPGLPGDDIADLMNADEFYGVRYPVSDLDLSILADTGWNVIRYPGIPTPPVGPKVVNLQSVSSRTGTTAVVLTFDRPMDPASTQDLANYTLSTAGRDRKFGTRDDKILKIASATFDPATNSVTVRFARPLLVGQTAQLRTTYIRDIYGHPLDGGSSGPNGVPFLTLIKGHRAPRIAKAGHAGQHH